MHGQIAHDMLGCLWLLCGFRSTHYGDCDLSWSLLELSSDQVCGEGDLINQISHLLQSKAGFVSYVLQSRGVLCCTAAHSMLCLQLHMSIQQLCNYFSLQL